jgi:hypothetical protein
VESLAVIGSVPGVYPDTLLLAGHVRA